MWYHKKVGYEYFNTHNCKQMKDKFASSEATSGCFQVNNVITTIAWQLTGPNECMVCVVGVWKHIMNYNKGMKHWIKEIYSTLTLNKTVMLNLFVIENAVVYWDKLQVRWSRLAPIIAINIPVRTASWIFDNMKRKCLNSTPLNFGVYVNIYLPGTSKSWSTSYSVSILFV